MRAVAGEAAFEQAECVYRKRLGHQALRPLEEARELARAAAFPARQRDVRVKGAPFGLEPDGEAGALDLGGEGGDRRLGLDARPQCAGIALLEAADATDAELKGLGADAAERIRQVL